MDTDDVVISGVSGRFPESDNYLEFGEKLLSGEDLVTCDNRKWTPGLLDVPSRTGKLKKFSKFDPAYFGIVRWQCAALDPITRHALECAYEAVLDAGLNAADLKGTNTNVYFGSTLSEAELLLVHEKARDGYSIMGRNRGLNANRISYWLDLTGSSFAYDSTWCSGLHGLQLAYNAIRNGHCDAAIVGNASLMIHPQPSVQYQDLNFLSPDGITRPFDSDADGYARSESVSFFLLQRAKNAKRSYGSIVHIMSKCYGDRQAPLLQPSADCWRDLLSEFYQQCRVDRNDIEYLEADAGGFKNADSAEMEAVTDVICSNRDEFKSLLIGSVKSNMGHSESGAASCSVAKAIITMERGFIPPNLHFSKPNPRIRGLHNGQLKVITKKSVYNGGLIAINSKGLSGTYGHLLLKPNPHLKPHYEASIPSLVLLSGRTEDGVNEALQMIEEQPYDPEYIQLINDVSAKNVIRHLYRGYCLVPKSGERSIRECKAFSGEQRPIWFIFAGMGSQWPGMARDLMSLPIFKESIDECHDVLLEKGINLKELITGNDGKVFDNILHCFVGIAAVQIALVDVLRVLEIVPDGLIGHSVGEMAAAYGDGCFTRREMILASYCRGKASVETPVIRGMMAAVGMGYNQIKDQLPATLEVACHNGPDSCTLSGPAAEVEDFVKRLQGRGVFARTVNVANIAYHSRYITDMAPKFRSYLSEVIPEPKQRSKKWISTSVPECDWDKPRAQFSSVEYHTNNLLGQVLFEEGSRHIPHDAITIEIAPHGLLQAILKRSLNKNCINIPLTNRNATNQLQFLLQAIGKLYSAGLQPQLHNLYPRCTYPVTRGTPHLAPVATWEHSEDWSTGVDKYTERIKGGREYILDLQQDYTHLYSAYKIGDKAAVPLSMYLLLAWEVCSALKGSQPKNLSLTFEDVTIKKVIFIEPTDVVFKFFVMVTPGDGQFEVLKDDEVIVSGRIITADVRTTFADLNVVLDQDEVVQADKNEVYSDLEYFGHSYSQQFKHIRNIVILKNVWRAVINCNINIDNYMEALLQFKILQASEFQHKLMTISHIRRLEILANSLTERSCDEVYLDPYTGIIRSDITELCGVQLRELDTTLQDKPEPLSEPINELYSLTEDKTVESQVFGYFRQDKQQIGITFESGDKIIQDDVLVWDLPKKLSHKQAGVVILPYCLAYLCLFVLGNLKDEDIVLITDALTQVSQAVLNIITKRKCQIFACVKTDEEKAQLLEKIPELKEDEILLLSDCEDHIRARVLFQTNGRGVTFVVSDTSGEQFHSVMSCWSKHSCMVQITSEDMIVDKYFYPRLFSYNSTLYSASPLKLATLSNEDKRAIKTLVQDGLNSGLIQPFVGANKRCNSRVSNAKSAVGKQTEQGEKKFRCDPRKSHLIIGGESNFWFYIVQWLVENEAKNIIIANTGEKLSSNTQRRLKLMQNKHDFNIVFRETSEKIVAIVDVFEEASKSGKVGLTVLIPRHEEGVVGMLQVLDPLCRRENSYLISVLSSSSAGVHFCKERFRKGDPTLAILCNSSSGVNGDASKVLQVLNSLMEVNEKGVVKCYTAEENQEPCELLDIVAINDLIPNTLSKLKLYSTESNGRATITELTTKSVNFENVKGLYPLILLTGLNQDSLLHQLAPQLMYPAFLLSLPTLKNTSILQYSYIAIDALKRKVKGPYVIIAEHWNGLVALELTRLLEEQNEKVQVYLLSGTPYEVQKTIRMLGTNAEEIEENIKNNIFNQTNNKAMKLSEEKKESWSSRITRSLTDFVDQDSQSIRKGLASVRSKLEAALVFNLNYKIKGHVTVITTEHLPPQTIKQLCVNRVEVFYLTKEEYKSKENVLDIVHKRTIFTKYEK